jgi:hypothetical protein
VGKPRNFRPARASDCFATPLSSHRFSFRNPPLSRLAVVCMTREQAWHPRLSVRSFCAGDAWALWAVASLPRSLHTADHRCCRRAGPVRTAETLRGAGAGGNSAAPSTATPTFRQRAVAWMGPVDPRLVIEFTVPSCPEALPRGHADRIVMRTIPEQGTLIEPSPLAPDPGQLSLTIRPRPAPATPRWPPSPQVSERPSQINTQKRDRTSAFSFRRRS